MKHILILLFLLIGSRSYSQLGDCSKFKNGKFIIYDKQVGNSIIERKGSKQVEVMEKTGEKLTARVKWVDPCTYLLYHKKNDKPKIPGLVIKVQMIEIREKSYMARISTNLVPNTMIVEIMKLE